MNERAMHDIGSAVRAIKTAILKSRYVAAKAANAEMLKLYYAIGGYVSANSRAGTWGTGAIEAISERLSKEMPGLRGFSSANIKNMRIFFENWSNMANRQPVAGEICQTVSSELPLAKIDELEIRQTVTDDLGSLELGAFLQVGFSHHMAILHACKFYLACLDKYVKRADENPSIGLILCHEMKRSVVEMTIRRHTTPLGVATYRDSKDVPEEYKALKPLMDGAQQLLEDTPL